MYVDFLIRAARLGEWVAKEGDERSVECTMWFALEVVSEDVVVLEPFRVTLSLDMCMLML